MRAASKVSQQRRRKHIENILAAIDEASDIGGLNDTMENLLGGVNWDRIDAASLKAAMRLVLKGAPMSEVAGVNADATKERSVMSECEASRFADEQLTPEERAARDAASAASLERLRRENGRAMDVAIAKYNELADWYNAGRRLSKVEPELYRRLHALADALLSLHEPELESDELWLARCADIDGRRGAA